nr:uncharacterized protein LOC132777329 [Anolis sagrei ordinatus]
MKGWRDTGADVCIIHPDVIPQKFRHPTSEIHLKGLGPAIPTEVVSLPIEYEGWKGIWDFAISPDIPYKCLIGNDLAKKIKNWRMLCEESNNNIRGPTQEAMCLTIQQDEGEGPESSSVSAEIVNKIKEAKEILHEQMTDETLKPLFTQAQNTPESTEEQHFIFITENGVLYRETKSLKSAGKLEVCNQIFQKVREAEASEENIETIGLERQVINSEEKKESLILKDVLPSAPRKEITSTKLSDKDNEIQSKEKAEEKQTRDLTVETDASSEYPRVFCETKIHTPERLIEVKITSKHDSSTIKVPDDRTKEVLKIGTVAEVKNLSETYQRAGINKMVNTSCYPVTDDGEDKKTLKPSTLRLKEERHFAESKTLDQLLLTNSEHFDMSTTEKKVSRKRRSNHISEEESPLSLSREENKSQADGLTREIIYTDYVNGDKRKKLQFLALEVHPDSSDEFAITKDSILVCSSKDSEFSSIPRKDVQGTTDSSLRPDATLKQAFIQALKFYKSRTVPDNWKARLKEETPAERIEREECGTVWGVLTCCNLSLGIRKRRIGIG